MCRFVTGEVATSTMVDELLRYVTPVLHHSRWVTRVAVTGSVELAAGDRVTLSLRRWACRGAKHYRPLALAASFTDTATARLPISIIEATPSAPETLERRGARIGSFNVTG